MELISKSTNVYTHNKFALNCVAFLWTKFKKIIQNQNYQIMVFKINDENI